MDAPSILQDTEPLPPPPGASPRTLPHLNREHLQQLLEIITNINRGLELDQVLENLYDTAQAILPCDRLGLALLDESRTVAISRWVKSNRPIHLPAGYTAKLAGSSLQTIIDTSEVRIIPDLEKYLGEHPNSIQTRLIVEEGLRSSLTCPLYARGDAIGFLFFTSAATNAYDNAEILFYRHVAAHVSVVIEKARLYTALAEYTAQIEKQNQTIHRNLEIAKQLQRTFIPERPPKVLGLDMALLYEPLEQVGGDLVELMPLPDGKLLILIADAMGHGVPAAMSMAIVKATFFALLDEGPLEPSEILQRLNESLPPLLQSQFAAALAMVVDPVNNRLSSARAGVPAPIIIDGTTGQTREMQEGGLPLSVKETEAYPTSVLPFRENDLIILSTDGLTESINPDGEQYGVDRVVQVASACPSLPADRCLGAIVDNLAAFRRGRSPSDDMTVVLVRRVSDS